jgi:hypothetical protein
MSVKLNANQLKSLARFERNYAVKEATLEEQDGKLHVTSTLKAGKSTIEKDFYLNQDGDVVRG